jgi:hypothetical protein
MASLLDLRALEPTLRFRFSQNAIAPYWMELNSRRVEARIAKKEAFRPLARAASKQHRSLPKSKRQHAKIAENHDIFLLARCVEGK